MDCLCAFYEYVVSMSPVNMDGWMNGWIDEGSNRVYNGYNDRLFKGLVSKH